jgi:exodeoxyribonuclease VII large subunit
MLQTQRQIFSVSELTRDVRFLLEENFSDVWVEGEITNFKWHGSGHMYFSLKDQTAQIQCVMFRSDNGRLGFEMKEGLSVVCFGRVSVYPPRGQYQLYVEKVEPKGVGALALRFAQLKEKLLNEGLFDETHKKPIPWLPKRIGVVTSIDGAALRDILHVLDRRFSSVEILIYPVQVQGAGAAESIAEAIVDLNCLKNVDVMIVARGGGSLEDLWAFNEEIVARAIFDSQIPVISAVGHEVDFTIADFVADLRAATPSAAAEIVLPVREELLLKISDLKTRTLSAFLGMIADFKQQWKHLAQSAVLKNPLGIFEIRFQKLDELQRGLRLLLVTALRFKEEKLAGLAGKLEALGPLSTLRRGFSVSLKLPEETVIMDSQALKPGDRVKTKLSRGFFVSEVIELS